MFNKVSRAIYYKEPGHILFGLEKKCIYYRNKTFRWFAPLIKHTLKKEIEGSDFARNTLEIHIKKHFGSYENYSVNNELRLTLIRDADNICNHRISLLGGMYVFKNKINWHADFKTGFTWPRGKFYLNYIQVDLANNADVKIPRELSRSHHFLIIGQAYLLTKDEKYAEEFISQVRDWINENPLMFSINWGCAMDVAIRSANWITALAMFIGSPKITNEFLNKIITSLYQHGWFIEKNLERSFRYNANHYDGDIGGLLFLGVLFSETKRGSYWLEFSKYALFDEIRKQIYPSGMELEKSTYYNRLVLEIFSYCVFLLKKNNINVPSDIEYRIHSMYIFIHEIAYSDKTLPVIGDNDSARFLPFDKIYRSDIQYLSDIASHYFGDPVFKTSGNDTLSSEVFFLLKSDQEISCKSLNRYNEGQLNRSKIFTDVGIVKIFFDNIFVLINNSSPGRFIDDPFSGGSHAHADLLSFVMEVKGIKLFVDPGSYVYTADFKARNLFRSTPYHNTISIDDKSQFKIIERELFYYGSKAEVLNLSFRDEDSKISYEGKHSGYDHLGEHIEHKRSFLLDKVGGTVLIHDQISAPLNHLIRLHFHLDPAILIREEAGKFIFTYSRRDIATLHFEDSGDFITEINESYFSPGYGYREKTGCIDIILKSKNAGVSIKSIISIL